MDEAKKAKLLKEAFTKLGNLVAARMLEEQEAKGPLLEAKNLYLQRKADEVIKSLETMEETMTSNLKSAFAHSQDKLYLLPSDKRALIEKELSSLSARADKVVPFLLEGKKEITEPLQAMLGLSNETLLWFYDMALDFFKQDKKEEASSIFQLLTTLNPLVCDYWIALGITQRSLKQEEKALHSFKMASLMDSKNPIPRYNSIEIHLEHHELESAKAELHLLEEIIKTEHRKDLEPALVSIRTKVQLAKKS
jgi:hypothetical protein